MFCRVGDDGLPLFRPQCLGHRAGVEFSLAPRRHHVVYDVVTNILDAVGLECV
jgi:hypothetical protein